MSKKLKFVFVLLFIVAFLAVLMTSCQSNNEETTDAGFVLLSHDDVEQFTFVQGEIDYSKILIDQVSTKDGKVLTTFYASESLLSKDDVSLLKNIGTYNVAFTYNSVSLRITITIVPKEVVSLYSVVYEAGEGTFSENNTNSLTSIITEITTLPIPKRTGYEFGGWYLNKSYSGDKLIAPYALNADIHVYARWIDERQFTVTFRSDITQEVIQSFENVEYGTRIIAPTAPIIEGYSFTGWRGTFDNVTTNMTVWAEYSRIKVKVTFTSEVWGERYGEPTREFVLNYGESLESPEPLPAKEGYTGVWVDDETGLEPNYDDLTEDVNVVAKYTIITYTVNFYVPSDYTKNTGDTLQFTRTVNYNTNILQVPAVPSQEGYSGVWQEYYIGRLVDADLSQNVTANMNIYARYQKRSYVVTFNLDYNGESVQQTCEYGDVIDALPVSLSAKYYSTEWYNAKTYAQDKKVSFPYTVTSNVSFYLKSTELPYRVDFCMPDKDMDGNPIEYYYGDKIMLTSYVNPRASVVAPSISLQKYNLVGWIDSTTGLAANFETITDFHEYDEETVNDKAFYAVLKVKTFTIDFYNMSIENVGGKDKYVFTKILPTYNMDNFEQNVAFDTLYTKLPDNGYIIAPTYPDDPGATTSDFEFVGWFTSSDFDSESINFTEGYVVKDNVSFYAKWMDKNKGSEELKYSLSSDGKSYLVTGYDTSKLKAGSVVTQVAIPRSHSPESGATLTVSGIAENAFAGAEAIKIQSVEFTSGLQTIASNALSSLKYLTSFTVKPGQTNTHFNITEGGVLLSADNTILYRYPSGKVDTSYEVPASVITISGGAFAFASLETVTFANGSALETIQNGAFSALKNLESITLPSSLVTIEEDAFRDCQMLGTVVIPEVNSLIFVGDKAFDNTNWWLTSIKNDKKVVLGKVLLSYNDYAALSLDISGYIAIADGALGGNNHDSTFAIKSITIGDESDLYYVGEYAFSACVDLSSITIETSNTINFCATSFDGISKNAKLYVPSLLLDAYKTNTALTAHFDVDNIQSAD